MKSVEIFGTVLKGFQQEAVRNGTAVLTTCLTQTSKLNRESKRYEYNRRQVIGDMGAVLFEAPTGTGKTLMAGHVAENISKLYTIRNVPRVIWFWFAPFSGLIDQAIQTIRAEYKTLRPKDPVNDRDPNDLKSGDVFVTTWATVAVSKESSRKARTRTETLLSIDDLIAFARSQGFMIGAIIDEAHHSFRGQTQAFTFYKNVIDPELTLLVTATPRDKDIVSFTNSTGVTNLRRISVSRQLAIADRLIKEGVKVAVFKAPNDVKSLIDFKKTALKQAVATHRRIKKILKDSGQTVIPLLLVQVNSEQGSVEEAANWLKDMGFKTEGENELIRIHTADEPDKYLSTIAADETVEVLIFKMAVATGFDVPRAFTLVSFRPNRDEDFGVQIVGRILRVDRRLQIARDLPEELNYGYVFLSDNTSQVGLTLAADRINQVKTEFASVTSNITVVEYDPISWEITNDGSSTFLILDNQSDDRKIENQSVESTCNQTFEKTEGSSKSNNLTNQADECSQDFLFKEWGFIDISGDKLSQNGRKNVKSYRYDRNIELGAPNVFHRAMLSLNNVDIVKHIVSTFRFNDDLLLVAQQSATKIIKEEVEIFGNKKDRPEEIRADLAQKEIDTLAQMTLFTADDFDVIDMKELYTALEKQLKIEVERKGVDHIFDSEEKLKAGLHKILALRPLQLKRAISETVAKFTISRESEPIPEFLLSQKQLDPARLNLYGIFPDDLNTWERPFAEYLDDDVTGTILWWHRNPPRKPYSVTMPLPGQPDFYPDFIVGVKGRIRGNGILLMETKRVINDQERNALVKAQAVHPDYEKVMMIYWHDKREWQIVEYDPKTDKNFLDRVFRMELLLNY
ncbi:DEAD/DEAH box helicase [Paenibacillus dendritiformis]|uniref:DEAD/DEAH box helicase n=1 Tax=Paenibacillus dendritiformis TaxID=130049 RepID=UPI0020C584D4|nr:DEAD/DEAH box helicase family protein [Paenibacillus dendritiformis]CAH8768757.1 DEAD/DEAH box helicase family protein [Paenibacillus dendritiformis]